MFGVNLILSSIFIATFYCILNDFIFKYLGKENPKSSFAILLD